MGPSTGPRAPNVGGPFTVPSAATEYATRDRVVARQTDPDLAAVIEAWPELPEAIKADILALVKAGRR
jgi:hypothetical protein